MINSSINPEYSFLPKVDSLQNNIEPIFCDTPVFTSFGFLPNIAFTGESIYSYVSQSFQGGINCLSFDINSYWNNSFNNNFSFSLPLSSPFKFGGWSVRSKGKFNKDSKITSGKTIGTGQSITVPGIDYNLFGIYAPQIKRLVPLMQEKMVLLYEYAEKKGWEISITSGFRTNEQQKKLCKKYKNQKGRASSPGTSPHEFGWAVDLRVNGSSRNWETAELGKYAESIGMRWGQRFSYQEPWHFDIKNIPTKSTSSSGSGSKKSSNSAISLTPTKDYASIYNGTYSGSYVNTGEVVHFKYADAKIGLGTLKPKAQEKFNEMAAAMRKELGFTLSFTSGYRNSTQQLASLKNHTYNSNIEVMKKRFKSVAPQGYSEHHTGYACDITINGNRSRNTSDWKSGDLKRAYDWLSKNASKYGFEQSFKANNKQGVIEEQWHWRFVGDDDSRRVFENARRYEGIIT